MEFRVKSWMTALALFLVQITFVPLISVGGFTPDLLIPWLLYVGIRQGQMRLWRSARPVSRRVTSSTKTLPNKRSGRTVSCWQSS